jgi:hypothetical protein
LLGRPRHRLREIFCGSGTIFAYEGNIQLAFGPPAVANLNVQFLASKLQRHRPIYSTEIREAHATTSARQKLVECLCACGSSALHTVARQRNRMPGAVADIKAESVSPLNIRLHIFKYVCAKLCNLLQNIHEGAGRKICGNAL